MLEATAGRRVCGVLDVIPPPRFSTGVRLRMPDELPNVPEPPDRRISWSVYVLVGAPICLVGGGVAVWLRLPGGGRCFLVAVFLGAVAGFVLNHVRPPYGRAVGRWRSFYEFLLRQMPPPD